MRFRLTLNLDRKYGNVIPVNYQYELSSWIYHVLNKGNHEFTAWLHDKGFDVNGKSFRLFTFSRLKIPGFKVMEDRLIINEEPLSLVISFVPVSSMEYFIQGLFRDQVFRLGDRQDSVLLNVRSVEQLPVQEFKEEHHFRCLSPVVVSYRDKVRDRYARYLGPDAEEYGNYIAGNLREKYLSYGNGQANSDKMPGNITFSREGKARSKLITIKQGTSAETKIRGFLYDFKITGPPGLLRMGYYAGFGEKNSLGFGCVEVIN